MRDEEDVAEDLGRSLVSQLKIKQFTRVWSMKTVSHQGGEEIVFCIRVRST